MRRLAFAATGLLVLAAGCGGGGTTGELIRQEITEPVIAVVVTAIEGQSGGGSITINGIGEGGTGTEIDVSADYSGDTPPPASANFSNGILTISYDCGNRETCDVQLAVTTDSPEMDVTVSAAASQVSLRRVFGTSKLTTASGAVTLNQVQNVVEVETASGSVDGTSLGQGSFAVQTGSGGVTMAWDTEPAAVIVETGSGAVNLGLPGGPYQVSANSGSGNVDTSVSSDPGASSTVSVTTGSGDITIVSR